MRIETYSDRRSWLMARTEFVTASDAGILFGRGRGGGSKRKLWVEKKQKIIEAEGENRYGDFGLLVEPLIAAEFTRATKMELSDPGDFALCIDEEHRMAATIDRLAGDHPVELKTAWHDQAERWDTEVPVEYQFQMMAQLAVTGASMGYFAVWLFKYGPPVFRVHPIQRDEAVIEAIREKVVEFWQTIERNIMPEVDGLEDTNAALRIQYRSFVDEERELENPNLVDYRDELLAVQADLEELEKREARLKQTFMDALGHSTAGRLADGRRVWWKPTKAGHRRLTIEKEKSNAKASQR